jgi:hypothetical protein
MIKKLFYVVLIVVLGTVAWFAFAIWIELYSVYSYPPSKDHPEGATLIIKREEWEPKFNSPDYKAPPRDETKKGMGWSPSSGRPKTPIRLRTIVKLPYVEWAYQKSLEPHKID